MIPQVAGRRKRMATEDDFGLVEDDWLVGKEEMTPDMDRDKIVIGAVSKLEYTTKRGKQFSLIPTLRELVIEHYGDQLHVHVHMAESCLDDMHDMFGGNDEGMLRQEGHGRRLCFYAITRTSEGSLRIETPGPHGRIRIWSFPRVRTWADMRQYIGKNCVTGLKVSFEVLCPGEGDLFLGSVTETGGDLDKDWGLPEEQL